MVQVTSLWSHGGTEKRMLGAIHASTRMHTMTMAVTQRTDSQWDSPIVGNTVWTCLRVLVRRLSTLVVLPRGIQTYFLNDIVPHTHTLTLSTQPTTVIMKPAQTTRKVLIGSAHEAD